MSPKPKDRVKKVHSVEVFRKAHFTEEQFRGRTTNRLMQLEFLHRSKQLNADLRHV